MTIRKALGLAVLCVAGCATTTGATSVAVRPIADGRPAERTEYLLSDLRGRPVGRVTLVGGGMIRDLNREHVDVSFVVENSGARTIALPLDQVYLTSLGSERIAPLHVNEGEPGPLVVGEGERRPFRMRFALPIGVSMERVRAFQLHWAISVDDTAPATRSTAFAAIPSTTTYGDRVRSGPEPGAMYHQMNDMAFRRDEMMRSTRGVRVQRRAF